MNDIKIFNNEELGIQVRTILNEDGSISINAEDTSIGFGWYEEKSSKIYPRWRTLNGYLQEFGFSQEVAKDDYIPESLFYMLGMKAGNERALKYQKWIAMDILPSIRKNGFYETPKSKQSAERLASVNNAVKILTPMLEKAGCSNTIQLLTAKSLYEKAGVSIPIEIMADQQYFDTVHIARKVGIFTKSNKPASGAVNEIIRRITVREDEYTETWESKNKWQGTVRKYTDSVIDKVRDWLIENDYPEKIEFTSGGEKKNYHVTYVGKVIR